MGFYGYIYVFFSTVGTPRCSRQSLKYMKDSASLTFQLLFFAKSNLMGKQQTVPFKLLQLLQDNSLPHSMGG